LLFYPEWRAFEFEFFPRNSPPEATVILQVQMIELKEKGKKGMKRRKREWKGF